MSIKVLAELERCGIKHEYGSDGAYVKVQCPFHPDEHASGTLAVQGGAFKCFAASCGRSGDVLTYFAAVLRSTRKAVLVDFAKRYQLDTAKTIAPETVERYHQAIWLAKPLLQELFDRGVTEDLIRRYRLGEKNGRITIPVRNAHGMVVNVRMYLPGAPGDQKMRNTSGYSKLRLFPADQLQYDSVCVMGGECKALAAIPQLNPHGVGCVAATGSEGSWDHSLTEQLAGKRCWVLMDIDAGGKKGAERVAAALAPAVPWLGVPELPLDPDQYPTGDVNDFVAREKGELWPLLEKCERWQPKAKARVDDEEPVDVSLTGAIAAERTGQRVRFDAVVTSLDTSPYVIPRRITPQCDRAQKECAVCAVWAAGEGRDLEVHPESQDVLELVNAPRSRQRETLMRALGVPKSCPSFEANVSEYMNAEDVRLSPSMDISSKGSEKVLQPALCVGRGLEANEPYKMVGRLYPDPQTQQSMLLVSAYEATQDALSTYVPGDTERLRAFQPDVWTADGVQRRLDRLYADLECNVTGIVGRRDLHLLVDLAYHSPLLLTMDGRVEKGWMDVLAVGDSSQGKSKLLKEMVGFYGLGERMECKNSTAAGLLGGLQQSGKRWMLEWGVIPTHDRRLVALDEVKGASPEVLARLTDMRSSGVAEITKIEKRRTHARTRLVMMSNPRGGLSIGGHAYGVMAILELMGSPEDVRRSDIAMVVVADEVDPELINQYRSNGRKVPHTHVRELCRELVLWAWTRDPSQVSISEEVTKLILAEANRLASRYTDKIPLLDRGSTRLKLARAAASLACRTFSTDDGSSVLVRPCHVEYVGQYVDRLYSSPYHGYLDYSKATAATSALASPDVVEAAIRATPFPRDLVDSLLGATRFDQSDFQDWCGYQRDQAGEFVSLLVRKRAIMRDGRHYRKTPPFNELLRGLQSKGDLDDRPAFLEEKF